MPKGASRVQIPPSPCDVTDEPARGGLGAESFVTTLGITYQQALVEQLVSVLGGLVTAADYPEGGEGRITRLA